MCQGLFHSPNISKRGCFLVDFEATYKGVRGRSSAMHADDYDGKDGVASGIDSRRGGQRGLILLPAGKGCRALRTEASRLLIA
jgi:hypothetical protein